MIQKMQMLQKRLISKTEEVVEKELLIQEKEKLYMELKHILARQPGPEVAEQLQTYQATLKEKTRQMKVGLCCYYRVAQKSKPAGPLPTIRRQLIVPRHRRSTYV